MQTGIDSLIQQLFISKKWTLSVAESCTGGHIAARLVRLSGCSQYFLGSLVAYSNSLKVKLLGVDPSALETRGAVSGAIVEQMALGMRQLSGSDYSIAISGIAGPEGGSAEKPVGTMWAAVASCYENPFIWHFLLKGNRQEIIEQAAEQVLAQLYLMAIRQGP